MWLIAILIIKCKKLKRLKFQCCKDNHSNRSIETCLLVQESTIKCKIYPDSIRFQDLWEICERMLSLLIHNNAKSVLFWRYLRGWTYTTSNILIFPWIKRNVYSCGDLDHLVYKKVMEVLAIFAFDREVWLRCSNEEKSVEKLLSLKVIWMSSLRTYSFVVKMSSRLTIYRKIPKISPSKYKSPKLVTQKTLL